MQGALLSAVGLGFSYERPVLTGFDLEAFPGSISVLVGLNGAGKTTALRLLTGQMPPHEGRVRIGGADPCRARIRRGLFFLPEVTDLPTHLSATEVVTFHLDLYGCSRMGRDDLRALLDRYSLGGTKKKRVVSFSKGMRRRLELACLAAIDPPLWILDEPQTGLDPDGMRLLRAICCEARERQRAIIMATHALTDVKALADRVVVLEAGRTVFAGDRAELMSKAGAREFVVSGGGGGFDRAVVELARQHGAEISAPDVAVQALERVFFACDGEGGASDA